MADIYISQLPAAASVGSGDILPLVQQNRTYSTTPAQIIAALRREGSVTVPADGNSQAITFSSPFPNAVGSIRFGLENYSGTDNAALSCPRIVTGTKTTSGFTVIVGGGQSGSTVTLHYEASGN